MAINNIERMNRVNSNIPIWCKPGVKVYSTKMWAHGDPFTIDGLSSICDGVIMTSPNGMGFHESYEDLRKEFAPVPPAPTDKQGNVIPTSELHIGDRVILSSFFKTDRPNTEGTVYSKEWDEKTEAWNYRIRTAECVFYYGRFDQLIEKGKLKFKV